MDEQARRAWLKKYAIAFRDKFGRGGQQKAADICGVVRNTYSSWEAGADPAKINPLNLMRFLWALSESFPDINPGETMEELFPKGDIDFLDQVKLNRFCVLRLSRFLKQVLSEHGLDWRDRDDLIAFATAPGEFNAPEGVWRREDVEENGLLYKSIAGTTHSVKSTGLIAITVNALSGSYFSADDIRDISLGIMDPGAALHANECCRHC